MIVLIPVATPVWSWRTASTMRLAIAAKARPIPIPTSTPPIAISTSVPWNRASQTKASNANTPPRASGSREPKRVPNQPDSGPEPSITTALGSIRSPATVVVLPKP